jgi:Arc/MetJ-type ribon-helix-helix transcriptional regulator
MTTHAVFGFMSPSGRDTHKILVAEKTISVRLDDESQRALRRLVDRGASQSEAIRRALIDSASSAWPEQARMDAERIANDPNDRAEIAAVRAFIGSSTIR